MTKHVMVIEDEPNIIEALTFLFLREGWKVDAHSDGASALAAVERVRPDVVILDIMLPHRSGFEILRDMRQSSDLSNLPVLVLTARGQTKDRDMAMEAGANRYVTKPFANADVLQIAGELAGAKV